jgi:lysyl-tRNA synthetase class I
LNIEQGLVMVASTHTHQPDPAIPNIACPKCGLRMQVTAIEPAGNNDRTVTFGCDCGHRYDLSERAIVALARDSSDRW